MYSISEQRSIWHSHMHAYSENGYANILRSCPGSEEEDKHTRGDCPMDSVLISFCENQVNAAQKNNFKGDREMRYKEDPQPPGSMGNR